ncbi:hypothetical protein GCM10010095_78890 [Streptomyces anthocyanicus]|nr:hypothetical protein GCM10010095_78890 [Streptomyces anthocyanicus]
MRDEPAGNGLPDFLRAFREEYVGRHFDGTEVFPYPSDGDIAERDLFPWDFFEIRGIDSTVRAAPEGAVSVT